MRIIARLHRINSAFPKDRALCVSSASESGTAGHWLLEIARTMAPANSSDPSSTTGMCGIPRKRKVVSAPPIPSPISTAASIAAKA